MQIRTTNVLHVVADDAPTQRVQLLRDLLSAPQSRDHRLLALGAAPAGVRGSAVLRAPLHHPLVARLTLSALRGLGKARVVHAWSPRAARWAGAAFETATTVSRFVCDLVLPFDTRSCDELLRLRRTRPLELTCESDVGAALLDRAGFARDEIHVVPSVTVASEPDQTQRARQRRAWRVEEPAPLVLILPPVAPHSGAFTATWGALVVQRIFTRLRILLPGRGAEAARILRTADATGQAAAMRPTGDAPLTDLLAAADLAVFLPASDMTTYSLEAAARCGLPIVASPTQANSRALAQANGVTWCVPEDRAAASRAILEVVDSLQDRPAATAAARRPEPLASPISALHAIYEKLSSTAAQ